MPVRSGQFRLLPLDGPPFFTHSMKELACRYLLHLGQVLGPAPSVEGRTEDKSRRWGPCSCRTYVLVGKKTNSKQKGNCQNNLKKKSESHSVMSDSLRSYGLYSPWNSPGKNTGVGNLSLLQGNLPNSVSNPGLPYCRLNLKLLKLYEDIKQFNVIISDWRVCWY